ncbi:unnamed protein product [Phyllotreta striolata]|uniref:BRISC and BRCA1-A complex member 2 n=1 Tax=Phyllotreta striolata TaxID=444603 RepID=A0A9N9XQP0_PHYSR|nr:unnamed protein product [Phyllotreta striolata]
MGELLNNTDNILNNFPLLLRNNIKHICLQSTIGFLRIGLDDITIVSNIHSIKYDLDQNFHLVFKIPYAGKKLKWEIIFDPEEYEFAPDFDFNDEEFMSYFSIETTFENSHAWKNWNVKNPESLSRLINEFLVVYKKYQIEKLKLENIMYSRYLEEYEVLIRKMEGIQDDNVQISIEGNSVVFLIALKIDCSSLPEYMDVRKRYNVSYEQLPLDAGTDFCHLKVSILKSEGMRLNCSVILSPRLGQALENFKFYKTDFKKDTPLIDIVSSVSKKIANRIQQIVALNKLKKIYITNIVSRCVDGITEYDVMSFNEAVFSYSINDYTCLVSVNIGSKFPSERPSLVLTSMMCKDVKCTKIVQKYPYDCNLSPDMNVKNLFEFLPEIVEEFKLHKH